MKQLVGALLFLVLGMMFMSNSLGLRDAYVGVVDQFSGTSSVPQPATTRAQGGRAAG